MASVILYEGWYPGELECSDFRDLPGSILGELEIKLEKLEQYTQGIINPGIPWICE